jgi:hypothetical protein
LIGHFKPGSAFSNTDLSNFYQQLDGDISMSVLYWRVYNLLQKRVIKRQGRGIYALGEANEFVPEMDSALKKMAAQLKKSFPYAKICLWNTKILNQWMLHQPSHFITLVEVEKDAMDSVFSFLQEHFKDTFLRPDKETLKRYVSQKPNPIIVLPLVSEAPLQEIKKITTVTLEKLIVDIFCEPEIFAAQQGRDLAFIYGNIFSKYTVNQNKMLRYADRRKKKTAIKKYLTTKTNFRHLYK